jgi:hypothetical protein
MHGVGVEKSNIIGSQKFCSGSGSEGVIAGGSEFSAVAKF